MAQHAHSGAAFDLGLEWDEENHDWVGQPVGVDGAARLADEIIRAHDVARINLAGLHVRMDVTHLRMPSEPTH